jgi:hypothetical protein
MRRMVQWFEHYSDLLSAVDKLSTHRDMLT